MAKQTRKVNTIKNGTIELVLLLLLQTNKKYGYQLAQEMSELSNGKYELKEAVNNISEYYKASNSLSFKSKWLFGF